MTAKPRLRQYYESISTEFTALKSRLGYLIDHNLTKGEWKEAVLRKVLRRHLPESVVVGRGFVVGREFISSQIDLLVLKPNVPTLFRDGDLLVVSPDCVGAVVSVKTALTGPKQWQDAIGELVEIGRRCRSVTSHCPWLGLFCYDDKGDQVGHCLEAAKKCYHKSKGISVQGIAYTNHVFMRFWPIGETEPGDSEEDSQREYWRGYALNDLAPSYFVSNLVDSICNLDKHDTDSLWFALPEGKRPSRIYEVEA